MAYNSYVLYSYGLHSYGLYSYSLYSYGPIWLWLRHACASDNWLRVSSCRSFESWSSRCVASFSASYTSHRSIIATTHTTTCIAACIAACIAVSVVVCVAVHIGRHTQTASASRSCACTSSSLSSSSRLAFWRPNNHPSLVPSRCDYRKKNCGKTEMSRPAPRRFRPRARRRTRENSKCATVAEPEMCCRCDGCGGWRGRR